MWLCKDPRCRKAHNEGHHRQTDSVPSGNADSEVKSDHRSSSSVVDDEKIVPYSSQSSSSQSSSIVDQSFTKNDLTIDHDIHTFSESSHLPLSTSCNTIAIQSVSSSLPKCHHFMRPALLTPDLSASFLNVLQSFDELFNASQNPRVLELYASPEELESKIEEASAQLTNDGMRAMKHLKKMKKAKGMKAFMANWKENQTFLPIREYISKSLYPLVVADMQRANHLQQSVLSSIRLLRHEKNHQVSHHTDSDFVGSHIAAIYVGNSAHDRTDSYTMHVVNSTEDPFAVPVAGGWMLYGSSRWDLKHGSPLGYQLASSAASTSAAPFYRYKIVIGMMEIIPL
jgi:hypothetical protein